MEEYSFTCPKGVVYILKIDEFENNPISHPVKDVVLETSDTNEVNIFRAIHFLKNILLDKLTKGNILYFITSREEIQKSKKKEKAGISNAEFRHTLFDLLFDRVGEPGIKKRDFPFDDLDLYISILYHENVEKQVEELYTKMEIDLK